MEYDSFEEGLRALASHDTGDEAMYGHLSVGLETVDGKQRPFLKVANHELRLSDSEAKTTGLIIVDCEKFDHHGGKISTRIEINKNSDSWTIEQFQPVKHSKLNNPDYKQATTLWPKPGSNPVQDVSLPLGLWRVSRLDVAKDSNSIGTILKGERAHCGTTGIEHVSFLHTSAVQR